MTAHERFRRWRLALGLSQKALADRLGCSQSMISLVEEDERSPGLHLALAIERETAEAEGGSIAASDWPDRRARPGADGSEAA